MPMADHLTSQWTAGAQQQPEEQDKLSTMAVQLVNLVEVMDKVAADQGAMDAAGQQFDELLQVPAMLHTPALHTGSTTMFDQAPAATQDGTTSLQLVSAVDATDALTSGPAASCSDGIRLGSPAAQVNSIDEADRRIDDLAASGQLSPALLLTMAKAYAGARDSSMTREEVKDIMAHLYFKARVWAVTFGAVVHVVAGTSPGMPPAEAVAPDASTHDVQASG
jgi:hypothetical protein